METPTKNDFYIIKNERSNKKIKLENGDTASGTPLKQNTQKSNQAQWLFMPVSMLNNPDGEYFIFNKKAGRAMAPSKSSDDENTKLRIYDYTGETAQKWVPDTSSSDYSIITNSFSQLIIGVKDNSKEEGKQIKQMEDTSKDGQKWTIVSKDTFALPTVQQGNYSAGDIPAPPAPNADGSVPEDSSQRYLIGQSLTPFYMVVDPERDIQNQIQNTPYYVMQREQYWQLVYKKTVDGEYPGKESYTYVIGVSEEVNTSFQDTTGITMTEKEGFKYGEGSTSVSTSFEEELQVIIDQGGKESEVTEVTSSFNVIDGDPRTYCIWQLVDVYTLYNAQGDEVQDASWASNSVTTVNTSAEYTGDAVNIALSE